MARVNFPSVFDAIVKLFKKIFAKDTADGVSSVIRPYLTEQGIVLADDDSDVDDAVTAHENFLDKEKLMEEKSEERDRLFDPAFKDHVASVQFLKKLFRNNATKLGEWGVTVDGRGRIVYATDFSGKATEATTFILKHLSFAPGASPLTAFLAENEINLAANKGKVEDAQAAHDDFTTASAAKEEFREERDTLIEPVAEHLHGIGQFLVGLYIKTPKKAGQWGFVIDDSKQADKTRDGEVNPGATKTLNNLVVGKTFKNIGPVPLNIYPGTTTAGTATVINSGESFTVIRGFGKMTIINPSNTTKGVYEGEFNG